MPLSVIGAATLVAILLGADVVSAGVEFAPRLHAVIAASASAKTGPNCRAPSLIIVFMDQLHPTGGLTLDREVEVLVEHSIND